MPEPALDNPAPEPAPDLITDPQPEPQIPQDFPENWRPLLVGDDEKELKRVERFNSPKDLYKSYRELEAEYKNTPKPPPEKPGEGASEEEVKAYREFYGIPETPEGYDLTFEDGTVIGEDVKSQIDGYLAYAHQSGLPQDVVKENIQWYLQDRERVETEMAEMNDQARVNGIADLKSEWGGEFGGNMNSIPSLFTEAPEGTMDSLLNARGPDGLKFANNPDNIRWLVGLAKALNPTASLLPTGATDQASIQAEIEKLRGWMNSNDPVERDKYWKDPKAQERLVKLRQAVK